MWLVPTLFVVAAIGAAEGLARTDVAALWGWPGDRTSARTLLQLLGGSVITVTSLTFSLAVVALQLASSQFSPRLLRTFVREWVFQVTLGVFLATFGYCVVLLRWITSEAPLPRLAMMVALAWALASVAALVWFLASIVRELRVEAMIADAYHEAIRLIPRVYPEFGYDETPLPERPYDAVPLPATETGFVQAIDDDGLLRWAVAHHAVVRIDTPPGEQVTAGTPLGFVWRHRAVHDGAVGLDPEQLRRELAGSIELGFERTPQQDAAFGFRQLVDIVVKAMSPAINDPTTATHAIAHLTGLLGSVGLRSSGARVLRDGDGAARVAVARRTFAYFLDLTCAQPRRFGAREPAVVSALLRLLRVVGDLVEDRIRRDAVVEKVDRLVAAAEGQLSDRDDLAEIRAEAAATRAALTGPRGGR